MKRIASLLALALLVSGARAATLERLDLEALRGKVVLVDFWASWCAPCKESFPWMQQMQRRYGEKGLVIVAVNLDSDRHAADEFLRHQNPVFHLIFDPKAGLAERYHVDSMPASFLLDRRGRQRFAHAGFQVEERGNFEKELQGLLGEPAPDDGDGK